MLDIIRSCSYLCITAVSSGQPVVVTDSAHQLDGHSGRVTCLSWSLHQDGFLATASYDWLSLVLCVCIRVSIVGFSTV